MDHTLYFKELELRLHPLVYKPAEDSYLLAESMSVKRGWDVLDIGTGCGILALIASENAEWVLATDVNPKAIKLARYNSILNNVYNIEFRESNLFENVDEKFDLIVFNPPYLPVNEKDLLGRAWSGGIEGKEIIRHFIREVGNYLKPKGCFLLLVSSHNCLEDIEREIISYKFKSDVVKRKKLFYEELVVFKAFFH